MGRVPALHCSACRRSFGGDRTFRDHRILAGDRHRCRTETELLSRGLWRDRWGVWHRGPVSGQLSLLGVTERDRKPSGTVGA